MVLIIYIKRNREKVSSKTGDWVLFENFYIGQCFFILYQNVIFETFFISAVFDYYLAKIILFLNCCI